MVIPAYAGMYCINHWIPAFAGMTMGCRSGFRRAATGILPSRRIQDILSINDDGVLFRLYLIPASLP